jgi:hypothetical protein
VRGQVFTVYIGDDETDEDAFRVMDGRGVGIRVCRSGNGTLAHGTLRDIHEVKSFLREWLDQAPGTRPGETIWKREDWR